MLYALWAILSVMSFAIAIELNDWLMELLVLFDIIVVSLILVGGADG